MYKRQAYTRLFHAAVNTAAETGAAILAHFELGEDVFPLIRLMERAGLPPRRLLACHLDRARHDAAYHKEVADSGAYLEYDTINRLKYISNEQELDLICEMLEAGYEKKLCSNSYSPGNRFNISTGSGIWQRWKPFRYGGGIL